MSNTRPFSTTASAVEIGVSSGQMTYALDDIYYMVRDNVSLHKSFDFSNVGIPDVGNRRNKALRQFHQTRLFIQDFDGMLSHGKRNNKASTYLLSANLPESFSYKIGSKWSQPLNFGGGMQNMLMQMFNQSFAATANELGMDYKSNDFASGKNRLTTMQVWDGSDPLSVSLEIPVIDDGYDDRANQTGVNTNFAEALEFLGSLSLPRKGTSKLGFYTPPPSPLGGKITFRDDLSINLGSTSARILLQVGGILLLDNCIVKDVQITYPNTKTMIRHNYVDPQVGMMGQDYLLPLLAKVTINITSVEALTADAYSNMLWLQEQAGEGKMNEDLTGTFLGKLAGGAFDMAKGAIGLVKDGVEAVKGAL